MRFVTGKFKSGKQPFVLGLRQQKKVGFVVDKTLTRIATVFFPKMKAKMKFPGDVFPPRLHGPIKLLRYFPANEAAKICKECCICAVLDY